MASIFDILDAIKHRPSMYVGGSNEERGEQLRNLDWLLNGYALAVEHHGIQDSPRDFPRQFAEFLHAKHGWSTASGPVAAIRSNTKSDMEAWEQFFINAEEFRRTLAS